MNLQNEINEEIEKKIKIMEGSDYEFSKRFSLKDYIILAIIIVTCFLFLLIGSTL